MNERITIQPAAGRDLEEQAAYLGEDNWEVAKRFLTVVWDVLEQIVKMPGIGRRFEIDNPNLQGLRKWPVRGFENYLIFYVERGEGIEVVRVLHGARDLRSLLEEEPPA